MTNLIAKIYTKNEFYLFLLDNRININIINKFQKLPEIIKVFGVKYSLYINVILLKKNNNQYSLELNYYSEDNIEFLFNYKIHDDIENAIDNLLYELKNINMLK